ncbi:MAG: PAS domain S-box protein [Candidatus Magasanikbacteria bacterium]|nr:PAS domain S-box protein [Candidatus Magasanikbacteria bacterium]
MEKNQNIKKENNYSLANIVGDIATKASFLAAIVESSDDAIIGKTLDGTIVSWNKGAERQYGYTAKEIIGKSVLTVIPKDRADELQKFIDVVKEGKSVLNNETVRVRKDGLPFDVSISISPIRDSENNIIGAASFSRSISDIKENTQYTRSLIEASQDPFFIISPEGKITGVNEPTIKVTGVVREKLIGTDFSTYFTDPQKAHNGYEQAFKLGFVTDFPLTIKSKAGKLTDVLYSASVYKDEKGNVLGIFAAARDVTASKQALFYARSVIEAGLDPMITISPEGKITDVNEATVVITGMSREQLIGGDFKDYFTDPEEAIQGYQQVFRDGFVREYPLIIRNKSGVVTDVLYNASVYKDDKGNVFGAIAAVRDITNQKKLDEKLHETSAYARSLIEASLDPLFIISPEGKITSVNRATEEVTGVTREWLIDTDFSNYFTEPHKAQASYRKVLKETLVRDYPLSIHNASGTTTDVSFNASVYKDATGAVRGIVAFARDVTETKKLSQYARSLIEASLDPLSTISLDGKIMDINNAMVKATGVSREELVGSDFSSYFTEPQKAREAYELVFSKGFVADFPLTIRSQEQKLTDVLYNASVYKDDKGNVLGVTGVTRDVTIAKKKNEEMETTSKEMEAFSGSASHDLRAPLRAIDGFSQILLDDYATKLDDNGREIISSIRSSAVKMRTLIDDLLTFSRLGVQEIKKEYVAMNPIVKQVYEELKLSVPEREIKFEIQELPDSRADEGTLRLVWANLISNAIKFTGPRETAVIEVGSKVEKDKVIYFVKDNGVGFDMTQIDKLFNVFQRLHSVEEFEGTGVGLANVKRIIERHGGKVWAEGKVSEGATFYFTLPKI